MRLRAQLPVYSPLTPAALLSGARAAASPGAAAEARSRVEAWLTAEYQPAGLLLTDSGTSALALALRAAGRERPGPVALPAFCCYDIATATDAAGVSFVLYDLDPATLGPDLGSLQRALDAGAGTVVIVHLYGVPVDIRALEPLVRHTGAVLIEDAAQGVGARIGDRPAGALGRFGILSFGRGKGLTGGRGGALLANDPQSARALDGLREMLAGSRGSGAPALSAQLLFGRPALYGIPLGIPFLGLGDTVYRAPHDPASAEPFSLGVLACTQQLSAAESAQRRAHARRLLDAVARAPGFDSYGESPDLEPGYLRLPVRAHDAAAAAARMTDAHRLGIWPSYPRALADLAGFGDRRLDAGVAVPGARELARRALTLPTHSRLGQEDLRALEQWLRVHAVHERRDDRG